MLKKFFLLFLLFMGGFFLSGCSKNVPDYLPLTNNSRWEYMTEYSSPSLGFHRGKAVIRVDGHEKINGMDYSKLVVVSTGIPNCDTATFYRRSTTNAVYAIWAAHKDDPAYEEIWLLLPPTVGKHWQTDTPDAHTDWKIEAIETAELIDRKYERCLKVSWRRALKVNGGSSPNADFGYMYLAPGLGSVIEYHQRVGDPFTLKCAIDQHTK
jgi:hypothetical protein